MFVSTLTEDQLAMLMSETIKLADRTPGISVCVTRIAQNIVTIEAREIGDRSMEDLINNPPKSYTVLRAMFDNDTKLWLVVRLDQFNLTV